LAADNIHLHEKAISHLRDAILMSKAPKTIFFDMLNILVKNRYITDQEEIKTFITFNDEEIFNYVKNIDLSGG
jgi:hypothetical protein